MELIDVDSILICILTFLGVLIVYSVCKITLTEYDDLSAFPEED